MNNHSYARVSVNNPQISGLFDYSIPPELQDKVNIGTLVTIPFGRQLTQGIICSFPMEPSVLELKELDSIVENEPVITKDQLLLAEWMAKENLTSLSACLELMLPPGLSQHSDVLLHFNESKEILEFTPLQQKVISLLKKRGDLRGHQLDTALPHQDWRKSVAPLIKRGVLQSRPILRPPSVRPKIVRTAQYLSDPKSEDQFNRIGRQNTPSRDRRFKVLEFLKQEAIPVNVSWVYAETTANSNDLALLAELELILLSETEIWRDPLADLKSVFTVPHKLTNEQTEIITQVRSQINGSTKSKPNLLFGVTGSGKTEVYLQIVEEVLAQGKQAIVMVPEISLTPQTVRRFFARFPGKVGIIHSKLSSGERYDTWRRIRSGQLPVVVGARSALFAPMTDLGLIVIDECHDKSYHQEESDPHYSSVETALAYASLTNAALIIGSATPDVEQFYQFQTQKWNVYHMPRRVAAHQELSNINNENRLPQDFLPLPEVEIVDMRSELIAGNRTALSRSLRQALSEILEKNQQAILLLNRRGSSSYVFCRECGYVVRCPRCSTQLAWHENSAILLCHRCGYQRQIPRKCPQCGSVNIKQFGLGTESLEKMVSSEYPSARVLRWDADSAKNKGAHDLILDHFSQHRADILIGTQMVAKGLDLPSVTLVGVVLADMGLNLPDFRSAERTFQLLTQVSGRAGRSPLGGKVILQTFQPDHYAIQKAAQHDVEGFIQQELASRKEIHYPPFSKMVKIEFHHADSTYLPKAVTEISARLQNWMEQLEMNTTTLIGPLPCFYQRVAGQYRWQILLNGAEPVKLLKAHPLDTWLPSGITADITINPNQIL